MSFVLLAIPIGVTLGILIAIDAHRSATGQQPLFQDNSVSKDRYCQIAYGISPPSKGLQYTCKSPALFSKDDTSINEARICPLLLAMFTGAEYFNLELFLT